MHVIVGQGQLDSVLHADPMGRRAFIEEAAGVLKHRKRKEKALRKLDAMQANLARVQDLTDELRRQLKPLGRQAAVARRAAVIQADLRDARLRLLADDLVTAPRGARRRDRRRGRPQGTQGHRRARTAPGPPARGPPGGRGPPARPTPPARPADLVRTVPAGRTGARHRLAGRGPRQAAPPPRRPRSGAAATPRTWNARPPGSASRRPSSKPPWRRPEHALDDTVAHRAELERALAAEERRLKDVARAIADRREGLARLSRPGRRRPLPRRLRPGRDRPAGRRPRRGPGARGRRPGGVRDACRPRSTGSTRTTPNSPNGTRAAKLRLAEAEAALGAAREAATAAERERAALRARHDALALGLRRKDGTGALLGARRPAHRPARPGRRTAHRHPRPRDRPRHRLRRRRRRPRRHHPRGSRRSDPPAAQGGRRGGRRCCVAGAPEDADAPERERRGPPPGDTPSPPTSCAGPAELMPAVRRLLRGIVVVGTLEEAEDARLRAARTDRGDRRGRPARGALRAGRLGRGAQPAGGTGLRGRGRRRAGGAGRAVRGAGRAQEAAAGRRAEAAALVEEAGGAAPGRRPGEVGRRPAARPARRAGARRRRGGGAVGRGRRPRAGGAGAGRGRGGGAGRAAGRPPRRCRPRRSPTPPYATGSPPTAPTRGRPRWRPASRSVPTRSGSRGSPGGPTRWTGPPARSARHARVRSGGGPGCATRRPSPRRSPTAPGSCWRTSRCPSAAPERERDAAEARQGGPRRRSWPTRAARGVNSRRNWTS